jgi:DNA-binding NarL/FixJ family response regulator
VPKPVKNLIRIVIVCDDAIACIGLRALIRDNRRMTIVADANRSNAVEIINRQQPDIILLDLQVSGLIGLDLIRSALDSTSHARVLVLTDELDLEAHRLAVHKGAMGLVLKDRATEVLIKAIEKVHDGEVWLDRSLMASVLSERSREERPRTLDPNASRIASLTARELQVLELVCQGLKNKHIADRLFICESTVRNHVTSILAKLELSDRFELALYAYRQHLATPPR